MTEKTNNPWKLVMGIGGLRALVGLAALITLLPGQEHKIRLEIAILLIVTGIVGLVILPAASKIGSIVYVGLDAILSLGVGVFILAGNLDRGVSMITLLAVYFAADCLLTVLHAFSLRPENKLRGAMVARGIFAGLLSISIFLFIAGAGQKVIALLVGLNFVLQGLLTIRNARLLKSGAIEEFAADNGDDADNGADAEPAADPA